MQPPLDASGKRKLRRLWRGELTLEEVASEMDVSLDCLFELARSLGLHTRIEPDVYMPSNLEIQKAAAEIRSRWTSHEREERLKAAHSARLKATP